MLANLSLHPVRSRLVMGRLVLGRCVLGRAALILPLVLALATAGCTATPRDQRVAGATVGTGLAAGLLCAALGGNAGRCAAISVAAAAAGGLVAAAMEPADRPVYERTAARVANNPAYWSQASLARDGSAKAVKWRNPDTEGMGEIVPLRTFTGSTGQDCREASNTYKGKELASFTVCRGQDGVYRTS